MKFCCENIHADLVVVGAGMPGMCAALQAAREGMDVVLINDRGCVGGNCSSEIFVTCGGAPEGNPYNINLREGGIVDEIRLETVYRTPERNRFIQDTVYMDTLLKEKDHLRLFLNTCIDEVEMDEQGRIRSVSGTQNTTETRYTFTAPLFVDDTGDGALAAMAGADFMIGRESKDTFGERVAPDVADSFVIPSTLTFSAHDTGKPVKYIAPDFAIDIPGSGALKHRKIPHEGFNTFKWFYEGDGALDQVKDREKIIADHYALVYGIWDYIKNSGLYPESENYDLDHVAMIPGMREYRRVCGDVILTESDLVEQREFDDAVGHGGWNIDLHAIHGFFDDDLINRHIYFRGAYQIPLRCGYSRNVDNLFMVGRCMSTSHVAFGSTRVAATLSTLGQAVGMAAVLCKKYDELPRGIYERHVPELQQRLLREDQLILGLRNQDEADHALKARVTASSQAALRMDGGDAEMGMGEGIGLILPLAQNAKHLTLPLRSDADTHLAYRIYKPIKGYNFGPDELIAEGEVPVSAGVGCAEIPTAELAPGSYYFFELLPNANLTFPCAPGQMLATIMYKRVKNSHTNFWSYSAMSMNDYRYERDDRCIHYAFTPEAYPYGPQSVVNGYNRACFAPNLWLSDPADEHPTLTLHWDKPVKLSTVQLTFGIDTTLKIYFYKRRYFDYVSHDYRVYGSLNGEEKLIAQVKDNHVKRNRFRVAEGLYDTLRFEFENNRGGQVAVQEVRAES